MALKELSDKGPDGTRLGQTSSDLVSFYGAAPVVRYAVTLPLPSSVASVSTTATTTWGFATSAQADAVIQAVARMAAAMNAYGLTVSA